MVSTAGQLSGFTNAGLCLSSLGVKMIKEPQQNYSADNTFLPTKMLRMKTLPTFTRYNENQPFGAHIKTQTNFVSLTSRTHRVVTT